MATKIGVSVGIVKMLRETVKRLHRFQKKTLKGINS